jgi:hypothetical protein
MQVRVPVYCKGCRHESKGAHEHPCLPCLNSQLAATRYESQTSYDVRCATLRDNHSTIHSRGV